MSLVTRIFSWSVFPVVTAVAVLGTIWSMRQGVEPALAIAPWIFVAYTIVAVCERIFPFQESWLGSKGDLGPDTAWFVTNAVVNRLTEPIFLVAAVAVGAWLSARIGLGLWPGEWPLLMQLALALAIAELWEYSFHRLMHENEFMWRFHAVHHSAPRLYWLNAARFHPIDLTLVGVCKLIPLAILGATAEVFALVNIFSGVHGAFQHANLQLRLGPLNWIFSMAELHRWHHSRTVAEANHNYGGNLILWDIIFGTRFLPADREPSADIGIADLPSFPMGYWGQLLSPFRWRAIVTDSKPHGLGGLGPSGIVQ
jgi:sterol desaturase/sphingolipid hydroxylase (fatty acid hydroxylase superfamily)